MVHLENTYNNSFVVDVVWLLIMENIKQTLN